MSSNGRAMVRPRVGLPRMKVLVDEKPAHAARREPSEVSKASKLVPGRERTALNDLSHPNRLKPTLVPGKENKAQALLEKQNSAAAAAATSAPTVTIIPTTNTNTTTTSATSTSTSSARPHSGSGIPIHTKAQRPVAARPHSTSSAVGVTKIPSTRHSHRESAPVPSLTRTASGRLRDEEETDQVSRKRIRNLGGAARPAPSFPSSASSNSIATVLPSDDDRMETSEADVAQDLSEVIELPEDDEEVTAVPSQDARHYENDTKTVVVQPPRSPSPEVDAIPQWWTEASPATEARYAAEVQAIRETFKDEVDEWDPSMVSEYADEIFDYMGELELKAMPDPNYMENQNEIQWHQRTTLVDWLVQIHTRYHLIPETLWIAINIIDRFLSKRVVSLVKLQLVGVTAMFIAAKYEEIMAPSVDEFVFMTENGYTKDEILKGEKIILQSLGFHISAYCSPYSWVRRISKADDYDIQTRTLSKFLMEACLLDHRFLCAKPSMIAAIAMYTSRRMLEGDWNEAFVFYSGFTEEQLEPGFEYLCETISAPGFNDTHTFRKYASKRFLKSSIFAHHWTKSCWVPMGQEQMAIDH